MFENKKNTIVLFLCVIFIGFSVFMYYKYVKPRLNPSYIENKEFVTKNNELEDVELIIFYTTWCPHSKRAMNVWEKIKAEKNNKPYNKYNLLFKEIDCDKNEDMADKYNIEGYPTIKLLKNEGKEIIEFDAKLTENTLDEFLNSVLY